jgi:hypothetical protein
LNFYDDDKVIFGSVFFALIHNIHLQLVLYFFGLFSFHRLLHFAGHLPLLLFRAY